MPPVNLETPDGLPASPEGYAAPVRFRYPMGMLQAASLVVLIITGLIFASIATTAQGIAFWAWFSPDLVGIVLILLTLPAVIVLHELIHGIVFQLLGYRVYYGFAPEMGAAYAAAFGQWQKRWHNAVAAAAPLVVITLIFVPMLTLSGLLSNLAFVVLLINTSGAVGDVYILYRLARMPRGALLYDISIDTMLMYFPLHSSDTTRSESSR